MSDVTRIPPSTAAIRAFEAAARNLSFTEAAAELGLTQGAVSHQIKELETRLGAKLFKREARGISLTEAGTTYLPFARDALERLRAGVDALKPQGDDNILTVSCSPNFAAKWLVPRLGAFLADHSDLDLRISAAKRHVTFDNDQIDLAVRHGDGDWPQLDVTQLCRENIHPVCSPHLLQSKTVIDSVEAFSDFTLLHDQDRRGWRDWLNEMGAPVDAFDFDHGPVFSETSLVIDSAVAGQGVALARSALAALDLQAGRLVRPVPNALPAPFAYWIVCPKSRARRPKIELFRQWLVAQAEATQQEPGMGHETKPMGAG